MIAHRRVGANGLSVHVAEAGGAGPLVMLLHGVPELWYSWRHQLLALGNAGYHAVAPDVRGVGGTDGPEDVEQYAMSHLVADVVGILDALGAERAALVGHDWGARVAYRCAQLHPSRVSAVAGLSVPYSPPPPAPPTDAIVRGADGNFSMVGYFQEPGVAEAEMEADPRRTFRLLLHGLSGDAPADLLHHLFSGKPATAGLLDGIPEPPAPLRWLTDADVEIFARAYAARGFRGALNRYRNLDRDWHDETAAPGQPIGRPTLFVGGTRDSAVVFGTLEPMQDALADLRAVVLLPGCGHWVQQERPDEVSRQLVAFLDGSRDGRIA